MAYDNTNKGTLGRNKRKEKDSHPSHTGKINVDGKDYWLSAWVKDGQGGEKFFSLSVKPKEEGGTPSRANREPSPAPVDDFDSQEIPF